MAKTKKKEKALIEKLTLKELRFCEKYLECGSWVEAYKYAYNYDPKNPTLHRKKGWEVGHKPHVQAFIREQKEIIRSGMISTVERVVEELENASFFDLIDVMNDDGTVKLLSQMPPHARRMIASFETEERYEKDGNGEDADRVVIKKIKMVDKKSCLEQLGRKLGMFSKDLSDAMETVFFNLDFGFKKK